MIASLRGTLAERSDGTCVVDVGGVGYLVHVSSHTLTTLPAVGREVTLRTRQVVREDAVQLFGFLEPDELRLFDLLLAVNGVGPRLALAALSGLAPAALVRAIREEQLAALVAVPGIGRKTAERLVVELRDKLDGMPGSGPSPARVGGVLPRSARFDDAAAALIQLGYPPAVAQDALRQVSAEHDGLSPEDLVRRALARLGRGALVAR